MSTFLSRLLEEKRSLDEKLEKLIAFFATDTYHSLPDMDQLLLQEQCRTMVVYTTLLGERIKRSGEHE